MLFTWMLNLNTYSHIHIPEQQHITKLKLFNEFYELDKVPSGRTYNPDQYYRLFEKLMTLTLKVRHRCRDHAK